MIYRAFIDQVVHIIPVVGYHFQEIISHVKFDRHLKLCHSQYFYPKDKKPEDQKELTVYCTSYLIKTNMLPDYSYFVKYEILGIGLDKVGNMGGGHNPQILLTIRYFYLI